MLGRRRCEQLLPDGRPCRATPLRDQSFCFWHSPETEEQADEARRLGGIRRRREKAIAGAYDFAGLQSVESIRRLLELVTLDTLSLENSIARTRAVTSIASTATKLLEVGELEARLAALESAVRSTLPDQPTGSLLDGA